MASSANGVFISYRRDESGHVAGRLADRLGTRLSKPRIFIDVDRINPGEDFSVAVTKAVNASAVLIVIIGRQWLGTLRDRDGREVDWVRQEISLALRQGVTVIPVLVDGATMPRQTDLPSELRGLSTRNAVMISHSTFSADIERLADAIVEGSRGPRRASPTDRPPNSVSSVKNKSVLVPGVAMVLSGLLGLALVARTSGQVGPSTYVGVVLIILCMLYGAVAERRRIRRMKNGR